MYRLRRTSCCQTMAPVPNFRMLPSRITCQPETRQMTRPSTPEARGNLRRGGTPFHLESGGVQNEHQVAPRVVAAYGTEMSVPCVPPQHFKGMPRLRRSRNSARTHRLADTLPVGTVIDMAVNLNLNG